MKLIKLLEEISYEKVIGRKDLEIKDVKMDSNTVARGSLFICIGGGDFDGHDYIRQVENYGGVAIVTERVLETPLTQIVVKNSRIAMSEIAASFYGHADKKLKIIGVTGTNGKTTTTHFITAILTGCGIKCGLIGTLGTFYGGKVIEPSLTTPDPIDLHKTFRDMVDNGVKVVIMEVSAHAIELNKIWGLEFEIALFTNFSQDHLDFFKDMESYKRAKAKFFKENKCKYIVSNSDDELGRELYMCIDKVITFGIDNPADVFAVDVMETLLGTKFVINLFDKIYGVNLNLIGRFNVYNALAAATACALFGVKIEKVIEGLENLKGVDGRLERVYSGKFTVFVDYAHTPDGLYKTLSTLKKVCAKRLISVFGCGGNRDKGKRAIMGEISGREADFTVITSDNPRFEEPMDIIAEIEKGLIKESRDYIIVQDRYEAIKYALDKAKEGDLIVILGKGSERYQEVYGIKNIFNDKDIVKELLGR